MIHKFSLSLCVLTGVLWTGSSIPMALAQSNFPPATQEIPAATNLTQPLYSNAVLTVQDLPPGFKELPPEVTAQVQTQFELLSSQLTKAGMKPEKFFAFINPDTLQMVVGFTGLIPNQPDRANFDVILKQMQQPAYQQQMMNQIRESIKSNQGIKIVDYGMIPAVNNNIGETASGMTVGIDIKGQILQLDLASFRRNNVGAFTAVMYRKGDRPTVNLDAVARQLDTRIVQTASGAIPASANESEVTPPSTGEVQ
ncbi:hypothetical protein ACE1B6_11210 [Aerosakkonemataceae cyanobacterium BLCC-F154]|uniref:Uncharacterized protein n=1 Tax=Floridaenema fluviatile BLCC-F154 TaxID=3153640 RepID=A0ABV4YAG1_9CYAN